MNQKLETLESPVPTNDPNPWRAVARDLYEALDICIAGNTHAYGKRMAALQMYQNLTKQNDTTKK